MDDLFYVYGSCDATQEATSMRRRIDETLEQFAKTIRKTLERANLDEVDMN